jgi:hypothetical protein
MVETKIPLEKCQLRRVCPDSREVELLNQNEDSIRLKKPADLREVELWNHWSKHTQGIVGLRKMNFFKNVNR